MFNNIRILFVVVSGAVGRSIRQQALAGLGDARESRAGALERGARLGLVRVQALLDQQRFSDLCIVRKFRKHILENWK